jgi:peptidoglycan/LPS O-acetylase OafA/YrhL
VALIVVATCFLPPIQTWWMESPFMPSVLFILAILFISFSLFFWKERAVDERDETHRNFASRLGYLAGSSILVIGIIVNTLQHKFDPWLVLTLLAMVIAKLISRVYTSVNN